MFPSTPTENVLASNFERIDYPSSFCFASSYSNSIIYSLPSFIALCPSILFCFSCLWFFIPFLYNQFPAFFPFLIFPFLPYFAFFASIIYILPSIPSSIALCPSIPTFFPPSSIINVLPSVIALCPYILTFSYPSSIINVLPSILLSLPFALTSLLFLPFLYNQFPSLFPFFHCPLPYHS